MKITTKFFLIWKIVVLLIALISSLIIPLDPTFTIFRDLNNIDLPYFVWIWANFDGAHYISIARLGYQTLEQPFFPLYPLFISLLNSFFSLNFVIAAILISNGAFFLSLFFMGKLYLADVGKRSLNIFFLAIILFPTSFFYGAVYTDALFLLFSLLTIYFSRKKQWVLASITGGLATLTRLNGLALFIYLFAEYVISHNDQKLLWNYKKILTLAKSSFSKEKILSSKVYALILIPLSFIGYLAYVHLLFKDWTLTFTTMDIWKQSSITFPPQVFWRYLKLLTLWNFDRVDYWVSILELLFVFFYLFIFLYSFKKIRLSYWILFAFSILIPWLTGTFQGMPRYGLHLYPLFLTITLLLDKKSILIKLIYFIISLILLFIFVALFTRGYFVA